MIEIKDLSKSYGAQKVLDQISLHFNEGEIAGVVGKNGAGKTTLFKCLTGLEGYDGVINYSDGNLKNVLGYLPTTPYFLSKITGKEYLKLICNARHIPLPDLKKANIFDLPLHQYADTFSTGMKKKLALTGTLLQKNEVFLFDEPFNGVDIQSNILIKEVLLKLKERNKIVILSSHIFSTLNETCDWLHYLKNGEILNSVDKDGFSTIEAAMVEDSMAGRIDQLDLI